MNRFKQYFLYFGLILASIGFWSATMTFGLLDGLEQEALRWRYWVRGERASSAPIVYVDLDAEGTSFIGDRPWDRRNFGVVLHALMGPGEAKAVGLDIIFSKFGASSLLDFERARAGDEFFGRAVEAYKERVVLAAAYSGTYSSITDEVSVLPMIRDGFDDPERMPFPEAPTFPIIQWETGRLGLANVDETFNKGAVPYWVPVFAEIEGPRYSLHLMDGYMRHLMDAMNQPEVIAEEDVFKLVDQDGWEPVTLERYSEQRLFTLGLELFLASHGLDNSDVERQSDALVVRKDGSLFRRIPLTQAQSMEVNWFDAWARPDGAAHYSMKTVLRQADALAQAAKAGDTERVAEIETWFKRFKDVVIFVGPVDPTLKDIAPTPFDREPVPKVGVHANIYRTIHDAAFIIRSGPVTALACVVGLTLAVALLALWSGLGRRVTRVGSIVVFTVYVCGVFYVFVGFNYVLPLVAPAGAALTATLLVTFLKLGSEEWERRRIKSLFGTYLSPELVEEMVESGRDPELGGAEAEVSVLFSDVEGFSSLSEQLSAHRLVALMNDYLSAMTEALQEEKGTLDKYIGDAIVTMFGMPMPVADHAAKACTAALRMQACHAILRAEWRESGEWPEAVLQMRTRIGINTGVAVVGNMGSRVRFNYTMMGDSVNLAARCESGAKTYGVYTMVTGATLEAALLTLPDLRYRRLDRVVVKGRTEPVEVFELWEDSIDLEKSTHCKVLYEAALARYFEGDWASALEGFRAAEAEEPAAAYASTTPSALLASRCESFIKHGPPEKWDGVFRMRNK